MTGPLVITFWTAVALVVYGYVGFPLLVLIRASLRPQPHGESNHLPFVSVVIAARNEEAVIGAKVRNLLALDYPEGRLEIIVASDGSEDGTHAAVMECRDPRVQLLRLPRSGKAVTLNAAVEAAEGDIVVFTDANSVFVPGALRALVRPFGDPAVGGVAGDQRYEDGAAMEGTASGEKGYWNLDRVLKRAESRSGSTIAATGAIYAMRRELVQPIPEGVTDDFFTSTGAITQGYRLVFAPDAVAFEPVAASGDAEFRRKVRVITRGLRAVAARRDLLNPFRTGFYAVQLASHKILRRLVPVPLVLVAFGAWALWSAGPVYRVAAVGQAIFYGAGIVGLLTRARPVGRTKLLALPAYFCLVNAAALVAVAKVVVGRSIDRWEPERTVPASAGVR